VHLSTVYVTYIIDKCAQMRETERTLRDSRASEISRDIEIEV